MLFRGKVLASCVVVTLTALSTLSADPPKPGDGPLGMKFVRVPMGTFFMGWDGTKGSAKETPIPENFEIAVHAVTQSQWQTVMGNNPSYFSRNGEGKDSVKELKDEDLKQFPVEMVSWNDAQAFVQKLNEREKGGRYLYRLPTEAEWEYCCRGGATTEAGCSHNFYLEKPTDDLSSKGANFNGNFPAGKTDKGPFLQRPTRVGSYPANKLGLYDMHGNVWQWCSDVLGQTRIYRGGSWRSNGFLCGAGVSSLNVATTRLNTQGLRVVRVLVRTEPLRGL